MASTSDTLSRIDGDGRHDGSDGSVDGHARTRPSSSPDGELVQAIRELIVEIRRLRYEAQRRAIARALADHSDV